MALTDVVLHGYWRSSATWRVRIGLALKGVDYTNVPVHLVKDGGMQHSAAHVARNPMHQVPVLEAVHTAPDGTRAPVQLTQSLAILGFLDAVCPADAPRLIPADPMAAARAWQLAEIVNAGIQPLQNLSVLQALAAQGVDKGAWGKDVIGRGLAALLATSADCRGTYLVGDAPSIADICLVPQMYNARRFGVDLEPLAALVEIEARCAALPAFAAAHPDVQPDAQPA